MAYKLIAQDEDRKLYEDTSITGMPGGPVGVMVSGDGSTWMVGYVGSIIAHTDLDLATGPTSAGSIPERAKTALKDFKSDGRIRISRDANVA